MRNRIWASWLLLCVTIWPATAHAEKVSVTEKDGAYSIKGNFTVHVSDVVAWDVLTDYESINKYVKAMETDSVQRHPGRRIILYQTLSAGFWPIRRHVRLVLEVNEDPAKQEISFQDTLSTDFSGYRGQWRIESVCDTTTTVYYSLEARFRFKVSVVPMPVWMAKSFLSGQAGNLIEKSEKEMLRRAGKLPKQRRGKH